MALSSASYGGVGDLTSTQGYGSKYGELSAADAFTIQKKFLGISKKLITMARFAQKETKPLHEGKDVRWRRYERFAINTSTISEGVTPTSDTITQTTIKATLEQYGSWVPITDLLLALSTDPIVQVVTERQAIQMAETMDTLAYNVFKAGSQRNSLTGGTAPAISGTATNGVNLTIAGTSGLNGAATGYFGSQHGKTLANTAAGHQGSETTAALDLAQRVLEKNDAMKISSVIKAGSGQATEPVAEGFFAITHTDMRRDIESMPGFTPVEKYASMGPVLAGEVGKVGAFRFITTTLAEPSLGAGGSILSNSVLKVTNSACDVYNVLIFAQDAVGCVSLAGQDSGVPSVVTPKPTSEDPLGQRGSIGYSFMYTCKILQDLYMYRIECACSDVT